MSLFTPDFYSKSIYDVPINFYKENNVKIIFCDLDNTLEAFYVKQPSKRAIDLISMLNKEGIKLYVISNNKLSRVKPYADALGVNYHYSSKKPLGYKLRKFIKKENLKKNEILMVGDQILTDVIVSKNIKVKVLLTEPLVKKDLLFTKLNRFFDKILRKMMKNKLKKMEVNDYE